MFDSLSDRLGDVFAKLRGRGALSEADPMSQDSPLLIVEDDLALQKQIKWSLDRFEAVTAHDRASALAAFRRHQPAVVTMDLGLPPDADGRVKHKPFHHYSMKQAVQERFILDTEDYCEEKLTQRLHAN